MKKPLFFITSLFLLSLIPACGLPIIPISTPEPTSIPVPTAIPEPTVIPQYFGSAQYLIFAGKVINKDTGEWVNDRLILLFLKGREIARTHTLTTEIQIGKPPIRWYTGRPTFYLGSNGIEDGLFILRSENDYKLTISSLGISPDELSLFEGKAIAGNPNSLVNWLYPKGNPNSLVSWLYPIYEGETKEYFIPSKNISYILTVLPGEYSQLPSEIRQPGSVRIIEGNRLVAIDPNSPEPAPIPKAEKVMFENVVEEVQAFPPTIFPINNCAGLADVKQEVFETYIHEIIDETNLKLGGEIPIKSWLRIVAEVERRYGISDKQITVYATTLTVPAQQHIQYTLIRKQTWESGMAIVDSSGVEISAPYRILKSETFEVVNSEQKGCP